MCRFILLKSSKLIKPDRIVNSFADMAKKSKAFDGDWQGDGWGLSWLENSDWKSYKSIKPIWEDRQYLINFPQTKYFLIHARSSSFPKHKNNKNYNQPFNNKKYSYVFNGLLKGVTLSSPGEIGSQKIWNLLKNNLNDTDPKEALNKVNSILFNKSRQIQALNRIMRPKQYLCLMFLFRSP